MMSRGKDDMNWAAASQCQLLETYDLALPPRAAGLDDQSCKISRQILNMYQPAMLENWSHVHCSVMSNFTCICDCRLPLK